VPDKPAVLLRVASGEGLIKADDEQTRVLLLEVQRLQNQVSELERNAMVRMARVIELDKTSKSLLAVLGHTSSETNLLQVGIEAIATLLRVKYGAIGILDELDASGKTLKHFIHTGMSREIEKSIGILPQGRGLLGAVINEGVVLILETMSKDSRSAGFPPNHPPMNSLLAVPISSGERVYGRIYLSEKLNGLPFNEDDATLVQTFARSLSKATEDAT
jgi:GAF domain-containing protein